MINPEEIMLKCVDIALEAKGNTKTNPTVGAAIVKDNKIIALTNHKAFGENHAEVNAMQIASDDCFGADLFVTLEPCSTFGKTPPCVNTIIEQGIKRVFIGVVDPNPENSFKGIKYLREHNVEVFVGIAMEKCANLIEDFTKYVTKKLPYYTLKIAQSIDGKIATKLRESKWITSKASREYVNYLRSCNDAILVGINTVLADDPSLDVMLKDTNKTVPYKIVLDSKLKIKEHCKLFENNPERVIICSTENVDPLKEKKLSQKGIKVYKCKKNEKDHIDLYDLSRQLIKLNIMRIMIEGGSSINGSFIDCDLVDYMYLFSAPIIIGGKDNLTSIGGKGIDHIADAKRIKINTIKRFEEDILLEVNIHDYTEKIVELTKKVNK